MAVVREEGRDPAPASAVAGTSGGSEEALEFVRFCYRRRGLGWPEIYDEMCAAAARGSWRGMSYDQLAGIGIRFSLGEMPALLALSTRVVEEERAARVVERSRRQDA